MLSDTRKPRPPTAEEIAAATLPIGAGIYKTEDDARAMAVWDAQFERALDFPHEVRQIETSLGPTRVIVSGPEDGVPVLGVHGALAGAPHFLGQAGDLPTRVRMYAVDVVGQSCRAAPVRPDPATFGKWIPEVLDALGLDTAVLMGVSWGGHVSLRAATHAPERLRGLVLLNAAAIVKTPFWPAMTKVSMPMALFQAWPTPGNRARAFKSMFTEFDDVWLPFVGEASRRTRIDFTVPSTVTPEEFAGLKAPVCVVAADRDLMFPGEAVLERAKVLFPTLEETILLENCAHMPPFGRAFIDDWTEKVATFLSRIGKVLPRTP